MAKQVIRATATSVEGYEGDQTFGFIGQSPKGNRVVMRVDPDVITRLAKFMESTDSAGHAAWHFNFGQQAPCSMCEKVEHHEERSPGRGLAELRLASAHTLCDF